MIPDPALCKVEDSSRILLLVLVEGNGGGGGGNSNTFLSSSSRNGTVIMALVVGSIPFIKGFFGEKGEVIDNMDIRKASDVFPPL